MSKLRDIIIRLSEEKDRRTITYLNFSKCKFSPIGFKNTNKFERFCRILCQTSALRAGNNEVFISLKETAYRKEAKLNVLIVRKDLGRSPINKELCLELPRNSIFKIIFNKIKCQNRK